jgi:prepilin-type N-terminal cleavage/methylation domain-containing protein
MGAGDMSRARRGVSLVETLVSISLLGILLGGIARADFLISRRSYALSGGGGRDGAMLQLVNRFAALPFDSLSAKAGTTTVSTAPVPYTQKISVASPSAQRMLVTIIVTPTNTLFSADTVVLQRTLPGENPFNSP